MKTLVFVLAVLVAAVAAKTQWFDLKDYTFEDYVTEYRKVYTCPMEFKMRKMIFERKLEEIKAHNADATKTWKKGINHMSDWTPEQFKVIRGYKKELAYTSTTRLQKTKKIGKIDQSKLPVNVDWRTKNVVTAVKDQGVCGSCWTFGTAEVIESYWALKIGELMNFSEQQILDCTPNSNDCGGFGGCNGGTPELAMTKIIQVGGIETEWTYPYTSYFGEASQCRFNASATYPFATISDYVVLPSNKYLPVMSHLANEGPLVVNVDASAWQDYESGVFNGCNNTNPDIDHVVQLVGYGTDSNGLGDYWLVRNSWNAKWGEEGYIRIKRVGENRCGLDIKPQDGTGCNGGPAQVVVCGTCGILYDVSYPVV